MMILQWIECQLVWIILIWWGLFWQGHQTGWAIQTDLTKVMIFFLCSVFRGFHCISSCFVLWHTLSAEVNEVISFHSCVTWNNKSPVPQGGPLYCSQSAYVPDTFIAPFFWCRWLQLQSWFQMFWLHFSIAKCGTFFMTLDWVFFCTEFLVWWSEKWDFMVCSVTKYLRYYILFHPLADKMKYLVELLFPIMIHTS